MRDQSPEASPVGVPVMFEPTIVETEQVEERFEPWGWIEVSALVQALWGVLLFVPGSQAYRTYIRAFPYVSSLVAMVACARSGGTDRGTPGASWLIAVFVLLTLSLIHPATWLMSGMA